MIRLGIVVALTMASGLTPSLGADLACASDGIPEGAIELEEIIVPDFSFSNPASPLAYISILGPVGWLSEGGLSVDVADPCGSTDRLRWRLYSPDQAFSVDLLPAEGWTASSRAMQFSACPARDVLGAADYVDDLLKRHGLVATRTKSSVRTDIIESYRRAAFDGSDSFVIDAIETHLTFQPRKDAGSGGDEGLAVAAVVLFKPAVTIPEHETRAWSLPTIEARAPAGALNRDLIEAVRTSALLNPNWVRLRDRMRLAGQLPTVGDVNPERLRSEEPFPVREGGLGVKACNVQFQALSSPQFWRSEDGRFWYAPMLPVDLAAASESR